MKLVLFVCTLAVIAASCTGTGERGSATSREVALTGTWKLIAGTLIEKGDTVVTDYTGNLSFVKIINDSHFAFLLHDINKGQDSTATFTAGGGRYTLRGSVYTEHLEYCTAREWEGHDFGFTVTIRNDTLVQRGVEKIEAAGVDRLNIETYVRLDQP